MRKLLYLCAFLFPACAHGQDGTLTNFDCLSIAERPSEPGAADQGSGAAHSGCPPHDLIVVPGRRPGQIGKPVTIITEAEIEQVQGADIIRILERVPSATASRNGALGSFTGFRLRGGEAEQLLVLIDGVRAADVASPGAGFDFGNLVPANIRRIEILRGSNSTIWGSEAMAGIVAIESARPNGANASIEYSAQNTLYAHASAGYTGRASQSSLYGSFTQSDGFSSAAAGTEPDGFEQFTIGGRTQLRLSSAVQLHAAARYSEGRLDIDGFPAPDFILADAPETQETLQFFGSAGLSYQDAGLQLRADIALSDTERDSINPAFGSAPSFTTNGTNERAQFRGQYQIAKPWTLHFGGEYEWVRFETLFSPQVQRENYGAHAQIAYETPKFSASIGVRNDEYQSFGSAVSLGGDLNFALSDNIRVRASIGEAYKAPTLFQLRSDFGNAALVPEQSTAADIGLVYEDEFLAAVTIYRRDTENLIEFVSCFAATSAICVNRPFGTYDNAGLARASGIELELAKEVVEGLDLRAVYAFTDTENRTVSSANFGNQLARRPRHAATLSADYDLGIGQIGADLRIVASSFDDAANSVLLDGYQLATVRFSAPLNDQIALFGRLENVFDAQYQTASGYATRGRAAAIGVRSKF